MTARSLTQARLKELLHYNPDTGAFTWLESRGGAKAGSVAGRINNGYVEISVDYRRYGAHRLAFLYMEGAFPPHDVDHEHHNKADNRWCKLRHVTHAENARNMKKHKGNTSGTTGVYWEKRRNAWYTQLMVDGRRIFGGQFKTKQEAITRRRQLEVQHKFHANHGKKYTGE